MPPILVLRQPNDPPPAGSPLGRPNQKRWQRINTFLFVVIVVVNLYVIGVPFLPQLLFIISSQGGKQQQLESLIAPTPSAPTDSESSANASKPDRLIIPSMLLDQTVVEGSNMYRSLDQGVWRWPSGSTPDKGSNTILIGHRFTYTQPKGVFYFLNKVAVGDKMGVIWDGKTYTYEVKQISVVPPTESSILIATNTPTLTLYTCTPLWSPKQRLVVRAELAGDSPARPLASLHTSSARVSVL